jgi:hypothetical protein
MKTYLLAAVAAVALGGHAVADNIGPPPPMPQYSCNVPWMPPTVFGRSYQGGFVRGCQQGFAIKMQRWRDQMDYWRAMQQYRAGGYQ